MRNPAVPKENLNATAVKIGRRKVTDPTNGGKTFSAARRGTENPPWVLVSLAVNVLQK